MKRDDAYDRLRGIQDELDSARFSVGYVSAEIRRGGDPLSRELLTPSQLKICARNLEFTYTLRLFAVYEGVLRGYWSIVRPSPRPRRTNISILMDRLAAHCTIPYDLLKNAHDVRGYRNRIAHPTIADDPLTFGDCKQRLAQFIKYLPRSW